MQACTGRLASVEVDAGPAFCAKLAQHLGTAPACLDDWAAPLVRSSVCFDCAWCMHQRSWIWKCVSTQAGFVGIARRGFIVMLANFDAGSV